MNAAPLQHFERWDTHNEGTQPAVRAVTDRLDQERVAVRVTASPSVTIAQTAVRVKVSVTAPSRVAGPNEHASKVFVRTPSAQAPKPDVQQDAA